MRSFDILVLADCRFPGGTSSALAQELQALGPTGLRVGLAHVPVGRFRSDRPLHPALLDAWRNGLAERVETDELSTAEVVVVHNPYAFAHRPLPPTAIRTGKRILVVHATPLNGCGQLNYDPWTVACYLRQGLGGAVVWAPISALCRHNMAGAGLTAPVLREEWRNIVAADDWGHPRAQPLGPMIAVGRHSRPELDKWPPTRPELFRVYPPDDENVRVRLLGVDERLEALAGGWPRGWEAFRFDEIAPRDFVQTIDFFVYFHHPRWVETFGRCTAEAIASGAVAILPPYMRTNFGDAAVYCTSDEAVATARRVHADVDLYAELSRRGREIMAREYGPERFRILVRRVLEAPADMADLVERRGPGLRTLRTYVALHLPQRARMRLREATKRRRSVRKRIRDGFRRCCASPLSRGARKLRKRIGRAVRRVTAGGRSQRDRPSLRPLARSAGRHGRQPAGPNRTTGTLAVPGYSLLLSLQRWQTKLRLSSVDHPYGRRFAHVFERFDNGTFTDGDEFVYAVEKERWRMLSRTEPLVDGTLGEGGLYDFGLSIRDACRVSKSPEAVLLMYVLVRELKPSTVIELGTNVGVSSAYLAGALKLNDQDGKLITLEASPYRLRLAKELHRNLGLGNVMYRKGLFTETLEDALSGCGPIDFAFVDGHHQYEPTLHYFSMILKHASDTAVFVFDDIRWSEGMERAWSEIQGSESVVLALDLHTVGMCVTTRGLPSRRYVFAPKRYALRGRTWKEKGGS